MNKKIIFVFKTHFDIGFTDMAENVIHQFSGPMLENVFSTCEQTAEMGDQRYLWTMPAWPLTRMIENCGDKKSELEKLIKDGRVTWHTLPFTSHFDFCGLEDSIQSFKYARKLSEKYKKPLTVSAKMTDVPGHGAMLPAILAGAGIRFLHLGCNEFAMPPEVPPLFFWEAPDGARVLTMYGKGGYGSPVLPPENWKFPVWMAMMLTGDNYGPQSAESIRSLIQGAQDACPGADIVVGTMDQFYKELSQYDLSEVPVIKKDLADTWIHGVGSYPREVSMVRETRNRISVAKKLFTLNRFSGSERKLKIFLKMEDSTYDHLILFGEHTWGLDVKTWMGPDRMYEKQEFLLEKVTPRDRQMESSWHEQALRAENAQRESYCALKLAQQGEKYAVFNPTGSLFTGWACADRLPLKMGEGVFLDKKECSVEKIFGKPFVYVAEIPAMTAKELEILPSIQKESSSLTVFHHKDCLAVENHRYRVEFNAETGIVSRVFDKEQNAAILEENNGKSVFSYQYDKYGSDEADQFLKDYAYIPSEWGFQDNGRENYPVCKRETFAPVFQDYHVKGCTLVLSYQGSACERYGDAKQIELCITLPPVGAEFFVSISLKKKQATPFVESGSIVMPLAQKHPCYALNKNGYVLNPENNICKDANHSFYCLEAFAAAQDESAGVCIVAHDTPLLSIGETGVYSFHREYEEHAPQFYFNLFNNMWGTNFPQWMEGDFIYRFTMFGFRHTDAVTQRALSLYEGTEVVKSCAVASPVELPENLQVMNMEPLQNGFSIRLRDTAGKCRRISVRAKEGATVMVPLNLQNEPSGEPSQGEISFDLGPYGIYTLLVKEGQASGV